MTNSNKLFIPFAKQRLKNALGTSTSTFGWFVTWFIAIRIFLPYLNFSTTRQYNMRQHSFETAGAQLRDRGDVVAPN